MREHVTDAVVLGKEPAGEFDARVFLYAPALGRISAKVTSARKITSKLNGHLEPLNVVSVRLIETGGYQLADALVVGRLPARTLSLLKLINAAVMEGQDDYRLWSAVVRGTLTTAQLLAALGFDPTHARCQRCAAAAPAHFLLTDSCYLCNRCLSPAVAASEYVSVTDAC